MVHYPEVRKRAQAEIDNVVGRERLPDFDDLSSLDYVQAVIKETMRYVVFSTRVYLYFPVVFILGFRRFLTLR